MPKNSKKDKENNVNGMGKTTDIDTNVRKPLEDLNQIKSEISADSEQPKQSKTSSGKGQGQTGKKRGPYRKKSAVEPEPEVIENPIDEMVVKQCCALVFAMIAEKNGQPHWQLSDLEATALAQSIEAVIEKYLPTMSKYMAELTLVITLMGIIGPRYFASVQYVKAKNAKAEKNDIPKEVTNVQ